MSTGHGEKRRDAADPIRRRQLIADTVDAFFGREMSLEERLLQALDTTDDPDGWFPAGSLVLLGAAIESQPGIAQALDDAGIQTRRLRVPGRRAVIEDGLLTEVDVGFDIWFRRARSEGTPLTSWAEAAMNRGRLGLVEALASCVEARYLDDFDTFGGPSLNDAMEELVRCSQVGHRISRLTMAGRRNQSSIIRLEVAQLAKRITSELANVALVDPSAGEQQFVLAHDGRGWRITPFGAFGAYQLQEAPLPDGSLWVARSNVLQPTERFSSAAIGELEELINTSAAERDFQAFFEQHPEFLLALGDYQSVHAQVVIHEDRGTRLIPDFFLEKLDSSLADICDLKRSNVDLIRHQRNRPRFRATVMEAIAQLNYYRDWFEDRQNREAFRSRYGFTSYRPSVVLIIGRKQSFEDDIQRIQREADIPAWVRLRTYDDVVQRASSWKHLLQ